jgi:hypothetical protein
MIRPTTLHKANTTATKIAVYDTAQKKPVLLFESLSLCAKYMFSHKILKRNDLSNYIAKIKSCCQKKKNEDGNLFAKMLTYRMIMEGELKEILGDRQCVILDEDFRSEVQELKRSSRKTNYTNDYSLEKVLDKGDIVAICYGTKKGCRSEILDVKDKSRHTPGTKYYTLEVDGAIHDYKANSLELVRKKSLSKVL